MDYEREKSDCKDTDCFDNVNGQCTRISDDGRYGICRKGVVNKRGDV